MRRSCRRCSSGFVNVVFTVLALLLIDRVGRRPLLMFGCFGIGAFMLLASYGFHSRRRSAKLVAGAHRHARLRRKLCVLARAGNVGAVLGDLSQPDPRPRHFLRRRRQLHGVRHRAVRVSVGDEDPRRLAHLPDLRRVRARGHRFHLAPGPETRGRSLEELEARVWCGTPEPALSDSRRRPRFNILPNPSVDLAPGRSAMQ